MSHDRREISVMHSPLVSLDWALKDRLIYNLVSVVRPISLVTSLST